jgi:dTDP-glucose pyrophosphorylase
MNFQVVFLDGSPALQEDSDIKSLQRINLLRAAIASLRGQYNFLISNSNSRLLHSVNILQSGDAVEVITPTGPTRGALASALLPIDLLNDSDPIVLVPTNSVTDSKSLEVFLKSMGDSRVAAGIMLIDSTDPHYSYARVYEGKVIEIIEKVIVGNLATTGVYFFRDKQVLKECARWAFVNNQSTDNKFYIAPSLNYVLSAGDEIGYQIVDSSNYRHLTW